MADPRRSQDQNHRRGNLSRSVADSQFSVRSVARPGHYRCPADDGTATRGGAQAIATDSNTHRQFTRAGI